MLRIVNWRVFRAVLFAALAVACAGSAVAGEIAGKVTDERGAPLRGVKISLSALHRVAATDSTGRFVINDVPRGQYAVGFSLLGRRAASREVDCREDVTTVDVSLAISPFEAPAITVTASAQPSMVESSTLPTTIIGGRELERGRGQSIMASIQDAPGVAGFFRGPGTSKPVVRGSMSDRVLVLSDGVPLAGQSWDEEQSPEIDAFDLDRVEIVRGPGSVLFGAGALGGVVNVVRPELRTAGEGAPMLEGLANLNLFSNTRQGAGGLSLWGATRDVAYRAHATYRNAGDYHTPDSAINNTAETEFNASGTVEMQRSWGSLLFDFTHIGREQNIKVDPEGPEPDATPFQQIGHERARLHGNFPLASARIEADASWQMNTRKEFETRVAGDPDAAVASVDLTLTTLAADVKAHHSLSSASTGAVGVSVETQHNATAGVKPLIPEFDQRTLSAYLLEHWRLGDFSVSVGGRFDSRSLDVTSISDSSLTVSAQSHSYSAASGTAGAAWQVAQPLTFAVNVGTSWRAPSASELFIHGPDEGVVRYKIGDSALVPERALNLDASLRYSTGGVQAEAAFFRNHIAHYIYLKPTGTKDAATGFDMYRQDQTDDATLIGGELSLSARLFDWLILTGGADVVRGSDDRTDSALPLMPAPRVRAGLRFVQESMAGILNPYLGLVMRHSFEQDRIGSFETTTPAYTLIGLSLGGQVPMFGTTATIDLSIENLGNVKYFDHLSRYKEYALDPGHNIILRASVPFMIAR